MAGLLCRTGRRRVWDNKRIGRVGEVLELFYSAPPPEEDSESRFQRMIASQIMKTLTGRGR